MSLLFSFLINKNIRMTSKYIFKNRNGDIKIINGTITWGSNLEWCHNGKSGDYQMPIKKWCMVKSYEYDMGGYYMLIEAQ